VTEQTFDYGLLVDEFRCRPTAWVQAERARVMREQRALRVRELALIRVLDERGALDDTVAARDGVSLRQVRATIATARALEVLPSIAAAAAAGDLSEEQLREVVKIADAASDAEWAKEAVAWSPSDLADEARRRTTPTMSEAHARRAARMLRFWDRPDTGMLEGRFSLPDTDGALVRATFEHMIERMRPTDGGHWASRDHRLADALVQLCRDYAHVQAPVGPAPHFIVEVPLEGPATVAGVPLPESMVEALRAQARIEPVLVDGAGEPIAVGRSEPALSEKTKRVVRQRDGKCRWPGCDLRVGLQIHHLWPRSWGGTDHIWNLASVCAPHHVQLVPQGDLLLLGNPNNPAGLTLVARGDLPALAQLAAERARAGPRGTGSTSPPAP